MRYSDQGFALTKEFEGCSLKAYPDPATGNKPYTVGFGHTGEEIHLGMEITQQQAELYLKIDIDKVEKIINNLHLELNQNQYDALVDFTFNVGIANLLKSTLLAKLRHDDYLGAADEFLKWDMAAGKHMVGLEKRREAERELFLKA